MATPTTARDDAIRVVDAIRTQFPGSDPMAYEPGFHVDDAWSVAWPGGGDWTRLLAPVAGVTVEPVSAWLVAIYPAAA